MKNLFRLLTISLILLTAYGVKPTPEMAPTPSSAIQPTQTNRVYLSYTALMNGFDPASSHG